jgi:2-polyprenyl-6-methoxyphenol hydroxylase-like FAD-dependent oxidoreductase
MQRYRRASVMIGVLPVGRHAPGGPELAAFFSSLRPEAYGNLVAGGLGPWKTTVRAHWPETAPHLDAIGDFGALTLARYTHRTMAQPVADRIAYIGDSAHATSPQLGQGANMALLDAAALTAALEQASDINEALVLYAAMRRWHVRLYQLLSLTLTPFYQSDSRVLPVLRDWLVAIAAGVPPLRWLLARMVAGQLLDPLPRLKLLPPRAVEAIS